MASFPKVKTLTAATEYPVTLEEAKAQCVVEHNDDDTLIDRLIGAATAHVEDVTGLSLVRQKKRLYLDGFCDAIYLPNGPVQVIDQVQYVDTDGNTQTVTSTIYTFDTVEPYLRRAYGQTWPSHRPQVNAIWVDYWAGYYDQASPESTIDTTAKIPKPLTDGILMMVADLYRNRESRNELQTYDNPAFDCMIAPYRVYVQ